MALVKTSELGTTYIKDSELNTAIQNAHASGLRVFNIRLTRLSSAQVKELTDNGFSLLSLPDADWIQINWQKGER